MSWLYRGIRPFLFAQEAEAAHQRALRVLEACAGNALTRGVVGALFSAPTLAVEGFGLHFSNPIGLAAGLDKHAQAVPLWPKLGFGFAELGGVTWEPQAGNRAPRLFRIPADQAIINRMGFNNEGACAIAEKLAGYRAAEIWPAHPVGINLGKSKNTPLERAAEDYAKSFRALQEYADFFVINVSSPNTPNLRQLQDRSALEEIIAAIRSVPIPAGKAPRPLLVKVAPDLTDEALDEIIELALSRNLSGIVATNTTVARPSAFNPADRRLYAETGGLSGGPLRARSTEVIRHLHRRCGGRLTILGVGGIFNAADAWEKITAGATLLQVYTGLVYEGPGLARALVRGLIERMKKAGFRSLSEAVGTANHFS